MEFRPRLTRSRLERAFSSLQPFISEYRVDQLVYPLSFEPETFLETSFKSHSEALQKNLRRLILRVSIRDNTVQFEIVKCVIQQRRQCFQRKTAALMKGG